MRIFNLLRVILRLRGLRADHSQRETVRHFRYFDFLGRVWICAQSYRQLFSYVG
jgi:hypothetical protein